MNNLTTVPSLDRLRFQPGQRLSPKALNAMGDASAARHSLLSQMVIGTDGIIDGYLNGFAVSIPEESPMTLQIQPGAAVTRSGLILLMEEPCLVNLKGITHQDDSLLILEIIGQDVIHETEADVQAIRTLSRIHLTKNPSPEGVEIARVRLSSKTQSLVIAESGSDLHVSTGHVDTRFAKRIRFHTREMLPFESLFTIRNTLESFNAGITQLHTLYPQISGIQELKLTLLSLRSAVADSTFSKPSVAFLMRELSHNLLDVFESIRDSSDFWTLLFETGESLKAQAMPFSLGSFRTLNSLVQIVREKLLKTTIEKERVTMIREALLELRNTSFTPLQNHALGGTLFRLAQQWDHMGLKEKAKAVVDFDTQKTLISQFGDGVPYRGAGRFYSEGKISIPAEATPPTGDGFVLLQIYKRRGVKEFSLSLNGVTFHKEALGASDQVDTIVNIGAFLPRDLIQSGMNELVIDIQRVDLDFGLMGVWFYQEGVTQ